MDGSGWMGWMDLCILKRPLLPGSLCDTFRLDVTLRDLWQVIYNQFPSFSSLRKIFSPLRKRLECWVLGQVNIELCSLPRSWLQLEKYSRRSLGIQEFCRQLSPSTAGRENQDHCNNHDWNFWMDMTTKEIEETQITESKNESLSTFSGTLRSAARSNCEGEKRSVCVCKYPINTCNWMYLM